MDLLKEFLQRLNSFYGHDNMVSLDERHGVLHFEAKDKAGKKVVWHINVEDKWVKEREKFLDSFEKMPTSDCDD